MPTVADIVQSLKRFAPLDLAASWDNVGLLLGDSKTTVKRVITCLTVTTSVVEEAIAAQAQLIITHHPVLFRATQKLSSDTREGRLLLPLFRHGIAVYSPHTAFDNTVGGINDMLAQRIGLVDVQPLRRATPQSTFKIVVFVPEAEWSRVADAMFQAGAGRIGEYRECSFRIPGTGTFFGGDQTQPTIGQAGRREEVSEQRLEVVCPESALSQVLTAMRRSHSYEEPAYDVYPLQPRPAQHGEGRVGQLPQVMTLKKLAQRLKKQLHTETIQVIGSLDREVSKVALACGAAGEFLNDAARSRADVFITGEMRFHDYLSAQEQGIGLLLPGHYATERFAVEELAKRFTGEWPDVVSSPSQSENDPVTWV